MSAQVLDLRPRTQCAPAPQRKNHQPGAVLPFHAPCPTWCTVDGQHDVHLAATGAVGARTDGRVDVVTVLIRQNHGGDTLVDLRALAPEGHIGALLNAAALDEVIEALLAARAAIQPRNSRSPFLPSSGGGRATTPREAS